MIPVIQYPYNLQVDYILASTDAKPTKNIALWSVLFERDTEILYLWNGTEWIEQSRGIITRLHVIDEGTGEWAPFIDRSSSVWEQLFSIRRLIEEIVIMMKTKQ